MAGLRTVSGLDLEEWWLCLIICRHTYTLGFSQDGDLFNQDRKIITDILAAEGFGIRGGFNRQSFGL